MNLASRVLTEWNRCQGRWLQIRECDFLWSTLEQNSVEYRVVDLAGTPALIAVATDVGVRAGIPENNLWLALWGEIHPGNEARFVADLLQVDTGHKKIVLGGDEYHFVSGVPMGKPANERLIEAFKSAGFEGSEVVDLIGDASSKAVNEYIESSESTKLWRFESAQSESELTALQVYLHREFPGRWTRELQTWRLREDMNRAFWYVLKAESDDILGFARMAQRSRRQPLGQGWSPGALRLPLSEGFESAWLKNDSCLGPIGVSASLRGQGAGRVLLSRVLETLRTNDAGRICIDWTNAFKYYYPLQFETARRYWAAWRARAITPRRE